jgi:type IV pilus assembly protein PilZ
MSDENERTREQPAPQSDPQRPQRVPQRIPIELKVEYKRLNTFFYDYTKNISKGGTFIKTEKPLSVGTVFLFKLVVPARTEALPLRGEVRWVVKAGEPRPPEAPADHEPGMGIRFVYETADQQHQLERTVEKMMVDSLGQLIYSRLIKGPPEPRPTNSHGTDPKAHD